MKRVVLLEWKDGRQSQTYRSVSALVRREGSGIGIGLGALWNALSKGGGVYENRVCRIQYKQMQ